MFYLRSSAITQLFVELFTWQPLEDSDWILKQAWIHSSIHKLLPTDQHIDVTLKQSSIRSIQNVSTQLFSFHCTNSNILTKEHTSYMQIDCCYSTLHYFFTVIAKTYIRTSMEFNTIDKLSIWDKLLNSQLLTLLCNRPCHSKKPS